MKTPISFLSEPVAVALGWTLLHALWQGFVVVLPVAVLMHMFRQKSSQLRYNIGVGALLAQVVMSVGTFWLYYQPALAQSRTVAGSIKTVGLSTPALLSLLDKPLPWPIQVQWFLETHLAEIVVCWLIGVAVFLVRLVGGWLYVQQLKTSAVQPAATFWQPMLTRLSTKLALRQPVRLLESARVTMPMVVGALKPVILLPIGLATGLTMRQAEAVLAHELAHIKRFDYGVNLLQSVVEVIYFFHPALWWLSARVREERENCCDDLAVLACGDARALAQALARVEEFSQAPVLAMALASHRKLLLNRVRRMLGVSVRPVVSNGHLLTLTFATILLATVSVYAMQDQPKPAKPRVVPPLQTMRRHKTPDGTEYGITANRRVSYMIWKGQKLPAGRVAGLQRQLDKIMTGQLSLDAVAPPDREILLTVIGTNQGFDEGMINLASGLSHVDYNNIVTSSLNSVSNVMANVENITNVDYNKVVREAIATASSFQLANSDSLERLRAFHSHKLDSLSQLMAAQQGKLDALRLQMDKLNFPIDEIERKNEVLNWRKEKLMEQRNALIEKHRRLLSNDGKQKLSQADVEKQLAALEPEIKKQEESITELNRQVEAANAEQERVKAPMQKLEQETEKIENRIGEISDEIGRHGDAIGELVEMPEPPEAPEAVRLKSTITNRGKTARMNAYIVPPTPARMPRPPKPPRPIVNVRPAMAPRPATAPAPPKPAAANKPTVPRS